MRIQSTAHLTKKNYSILHHIFHQKVARCNATRQQDTQETWLNDDEHDMHKEKIL